MSHESSSSSSSSSNRNANEQGDSDMVIMGYSLVPAVMAVLYGKAFYLPNMGLGHDDDDD
ncbi:hypothetical protein N7462_010524 [Penicillium macrosclerotiorum]|uniref:uncharacterized protein n=1 Tax=Penicillium macrosclerotiorum TaxID=303699 RepID=UPI002548607A|nr:uncharacterized protein N7462_010524 [Penicillium macrosclerotiorum]KAJ5669454.1 hypothetical protein N7462_010524 [Penicillium macrosclerotiorum]